MSRKLSKKEALRMCRKLWKWLAKHPGLGKSEAFHDLKLPHMSCGCPCCEYNKQRGIMEGDGHAACAKRCLLRDLWPNGCLGKGSPFSEWEYSGWFDTESAMKIANACKQRRHNISGQVGGEVMASGYAFSGKEGRVYMVRCLRCGGEVYGPAVSSGTCHLCGYNVKDDPDMLLKIKNAGGGLRVDIP